MYKVGIETKQGILRAARELFYEHGYKKTSILRICEECGIQLGTFTYHYPKKSGLLNDIYSDYMSRVIRFVDDRKAIESPANHHLHVLAVYYTHLYADKKVMCFHREVLEIGSMNIWFNNPRKLISSFSGEGRIVSEDPHFNLFVKADNAARRELNLDFIYGGDHSPEAVSALLHEIYAINAKLFDVEYDHMERYLEEAFSFAMEHIDEELSLLHGIPEEMAE